MTRSIESLLSDVEGELKQEANAKRPPEERMLHSVAQRLLLLERDLRAPGATRSTEERVDRILEAIAKEKF